MTSDDQPKRTTALQLAGLVLVALVLALLPALPAEFWGPVRPSRPALGSGVAPRPNIVVIQTDDQDPGTVTPAVMPNVVRHIAEHGTTFTNYTVSGPLCCPSRAVMLTGQYGHNNGVIWNNPGYADLLEKDNTLPVWLQEAGYKTAHLGKWLNLYARATGDPNAVPPGWDQWASVLGPLNGPKPTTPPPYYDYTLRHNGSAIKFGSDKRDYLTDVLTSKAVALIHRYVPGPQPFFMIVDEIAPHSGPNRDPRCRGSALPARRDGDAFGDAVLPMPPSFNETDVSDKPRFVRIQPRMTAADIAEVRRRRNCRLASLKAVDLGVQRIVQALGEEHELWDTAIFYLSDNGFLLGEHRLFGKLNPYEESLRVPFTIRLPKRFLAPDGAPRQLPSVAANIDVAPTILDLAGTEPCNIAEACRVLDGRSLLPAIQSGGADWPATRGIALELSTSWKARSGMPCKYQGIRTAGHLFVEYHSINLGEGCVPDNEVEDYDLRSDPFELHNRFPARLGTAAAKQQEALRSRTKKLSDCSGIRGRDPEPAWGHYCE